MSTGKNHHFVPQFYFRRFSADEKSICSLIRHSGNVIPKAPIKGQASKHWFYGDAETEKALADIEGVCSTALRELSALDDPTKLAGEHVEALMLHLALQRSRTDSARRTNKPIQDNLARLMAEVAVNTSEELEDEEKTRLRLLLPQFEADPVAAQKLAMAAAVESASALLDLRPVLLVNRTTRPFIFGDAPVVFFNAYCRNVRHRGVLGLASPGLLVAFPLSPNSALLLMDAEVYRTRSPHKNRVHLRDLGDVAGLNRLQMHAASNCVYFGDMRYAGYVKALWEQERGRLTKHAGAVVQAPGFDARTGNALGDIVHSFEPQLAYLPRLSFLRHETVGDGDSRPLRRRAVGDPNDAGWGVLRGALAPDSTV